MSEVIYMKDIVSRVAEQEGLTKKDVDRVIGAALNEIVGHVSEGVGNKVRFLQFGTFEARHQPARTAHNPATGEKIQVEAKTTLAFKPTSKLRDL